MSLGAGPITPPLAGRLGAGPAVTAEVTGDLVTLHGVVERAYQKSCAEATEMAHVAFAPARAVSDAAHFMFHNP